jgi:hypothetical protein
VTSFDSRPGPGCGRNKTRPARLIFSGADWMTRWPVAFPLPSSLAQLRIDGGYFIIPNGWLYFSSLPPRRISNACSVFFASSSFF